ncbi:acyl-CoA-like ligand-binding transcription factor [Streptosporangium sp. NPDC003464]
MSSPPCPEGLRERKKAKTRRTIQDHALRLFAEQGYEATTVEQIADAAEISPSTFFRYFPVKEDVAVPDDYGPLLLEALAAQPAGLGPVPALRAAVRAVFGRLSPEEELHILARVRLQLSHAALHSRTVDRTITMIGLLAAGVARRRGLGAVDPLSRTAAGAVVGALLPAVSAWAEGSGAGRLADALDEALALLESGLCP